MNAKKFFLWLGVFAVLVICLIGSCLLAGFTLSELGREITGEAWREAGNIGREGEEGFAVNETYDLSFDDDGAGYFAGGGFSLPLPPGYRVKTPEGRSAEAPPFQYFFLAADGKTQIRLRREEDVPGEHFWYGGDRQLLFARAQAYAERLAGKAAVEATPLAYVGPSRLETSLSDVGVEGCYRYTAPERERQGFDGEYFLLLGRGYGNAVMVSVAFKPFTREKALARGRELADPVQFN
ncbi:MAG: hypothetical protein JSU81_11010 [Candidatus Coatesbacteria bacterium]|nr:MAG: hypothetical protein JSU81_11010 [Candidatus Coatesbacteria bacterium]